MESSNLILHENDVSYLNTNTTYFSTSSKFKISKFNHLEVLTNENMFGLAVKTGFSYDGEFSEINFMYYPYLPAVDDIKLDPDDQQMKSSELNIQHLKKRLYQNWLTF